MALDVAERHGLEIVSMDSMQVYRGMDIGTAKPTEDEQRRVRHHLLDVVDPDDEWTVADHQRRVLDLLDGASRPLLLVGGTGLYVRAVIDRFEIPGEYPEVVADLRGEATLEDSLDEAIRRTRRFARRQERWFRRDPRWVRLSYDDHPSEVERRIAEVAVSLL